MRICHINLAKSYRGGERQTELLIRELAGRGVTQRLLMRRGSVLKNQCSGIPDLELVEVGNNPIAAALAARGADVVQVHEARSVYSAWFASLLFGIPYVITRRVTNPQRRSWVRDRAYRNAGSLVAISRAVAASMRPSYEDLDFDIVPDAHAALWTNPDAVKALKARYPGKVVIGHVGALDHSHKGQRTIIEAAQSVRDTHPDWHFLLVGSGPDEAEFRAAIGDLDNIELTGFVENIGDIYAILDVFVFPSLKEAIGSAMLDAMHFGLPIVASGVEGIPEFVEDGVNGRLIQPERPEQLVAAIEEVIRRSQWTADVRAANREKAVTLNAAKMADRYESIYARLMSH